MEKVRESNVGTQAGVPVGCKEKQGGWDGHLWLAVNHGRLFNPPLPGVSHDIVIPGYLPSMGSRVRNTTYSSAKQNTP